METRKILERLKNLKNAIANKVSDGNTDCFIFNKRILAVREDIIISTKNVTEIVGAFSAKDIIKGLETIKSEEVEFSTEDDNLIMFNDSSKIKICGNDDEYEKYSEHEDIVKVKNSDWVAVPDGFMEGLMLCAETSSRDIKDGDVSCVAIKNNIVEATDDVRASIFKCKFHVDEDVYLLASNVKKIPEHCDKIFISENMVHFGWGNFTYSLPKISADFPEIYETIKACIPEERNPISFPKELISLAKDIEHFCGGDSDREKSVKVTFTPKEIKCVAKKETASITKRIENNTGTKKGSFKINPTLLSSMVSNNDEVFIHGDKIFFMRKNFIHVIGM